MHIFDLVFASFFLFLMSSIIVPHHILENVNSSCRFQSNWALNLHDNADDTTVESADEKLLDVELSKVSGNGGAIAVHIIPATSQSNIKITNTTFTNNTAATYGGTLYFGAYVQGELSNNTFENVFTDTEDTIRPHVGDVAEFRGSLQFIDNVIDVITAKSAIPIISYRASDIGSFMESDNMQFFCPVGFKSQTVSTYVVLSVERKPIETLLLYCIPCNEALYSLVQPHIMINNLKVVQLTESECLPCPYGAQCNINVQAKANFWGESFNNTVAMYLCPQEYCCQNLTCATFDVCSSNRVGILCGQCDDGFSESLFSAECIANDDCTYASTFWVVIVVYGILYVAFFIMEEECELLVRKLTIWLKFVFLKRIKRKIMKCFNFSKRQEKITIHQSEDDGTVGAYLSIFMYYIQIPNILKVSILYRDHSREAPLSYIGNTVKNIFSFNTFGIHLKTCIFEGVTAIFKIWIKLGFVLYLFGVLVVLFILVRTIAKAIGPQREDSYFAKSAPINAKFIAAFVSLLMYTYQYLAENSFVMLKCIDIASTDESVLFIDANVICYQPWQFAVIIFVCVHVIPFATVLAIAPDLMRRNVIGVKLFIISLFIPLFSAPFLLSRFIRHRVTKARRKTKNIETDVHTAKPKKDAKYLVSRLLTDPYKNTFAWGICWEGVIALRRLLLIVIATFTPSLLFRHILLGLGCQLSLVMQLIVKPFVKTSCNVLETLSLSILLLVSMMNLLKAAYFQSGEIPDSTADKVFEIYDWIEAILFAIIPLVIVGVVVAGVLIRMLALPLGIGITRTTPDYDKFEEPQEFRQFKQLTRESQYYVGEAHHRTSLYQKQPSSTNGAISVILQRYNSVLVNTNSQLSKRSRFIDPPKPRDDKENIEKAGNTERHHKHQMQQSSSEESMVFKSPAIRYSANYRKQ